MTLMMNQIILQQMEPVMAMAIVVVCTLLLKKTNVCMKSLM